jgi:steroid delta-isomerase-like uncharacterized protein
MSVQENKSILRRIFDEIWNEGKVAVIDELYAADAVLHDPFVSKQFRGPEGIKRYTATFRSAFPDVHFTLAAMIGEEDLVVARWIARGTFTGPLLGIKPTGTSGMVTGVTIARLIGGKVVESWEQRDDLGMLRQAGVVPDPAAVSA